jgi:hypothetical protein
MEFRHLDIQQLKKLNPGIFFIFMWYITWRGVTIRANNSVAKIAGYR